MPTYRFSCKSCEKEKTTTCSWKDYDSKKAEMLCCDTEMNREFSATPTKNDSKHNDPNSPWYWKKGKTIPQQADVLTSGTDWV